MKSLKVYVAGKVSKESSFGTHYWRDDFCSELHKLSGIKIICIDPTKSGIDQNNKEMVFGGDAFMIKQCDVFIVYLSDDISIGGSQEILIAKYFNKPVIGLAKKGGKFNGSKRVFFGQEINNYKDPFVYTTCDIVTEDVDGVAKALNKINKIKVKQINIIDKLSNEFEIKHLINHSYIKRITKHVE